MRFYAILFIFVVLMFTSCEKNDVKPVPEKEIVGELEKTLPLTEANLVNTINPYDQYRSGIKDFIAEVKLLTDDPENSDLETFESNLEDLIENGDWEYPAIDEGTYSDYSSLLGDFFDEEISSENLISITRAYEDDIYNSNYSDSTKNVCYYIISMYKFSMYFTIDQYGSKYSLWEARVHNYIYAELNDIWDNPVKAALFIAQLPASFIAIVGAAIWDASFNN